jgi:hypothetical protein
MFSVRVTHLVLYLLTGGKTSRKGDPKEMIGQKWAVKKGDKERDIEETRKCEIEIEKECIQENET